MGYGIDMLSTVLTGTERRFPDGFRTVRVVVRNKVRFSPIYWRLQYRRHFMNVP